VVDRAREHPRELGSPDALLERGDLRLGLGDGRLVVLGRPELEQDARVLEVARQLLDAPDLLLDPGAATGDALGLLLIVPETRGEGQLLEPVDLRLELREVKDAPLAP
jgi:hypothetical protein